MIEHMATVLHHSRARGTDKLVLIGIANHDGDGGSFPSLATLAKYANVDERTVRRSLRVLEELGEINVHVNEGGTRHTRADRRPNRYEILVRCPQGCDGGPQHRVPAPSVVEDDSRLGDGDLDGRTSTSSRDDDGGTSTSPRDGQRGDVDVTDGGTWASPEPSLNHPTSNHGTEPPSATVPRRHDDVWDAVLIACHLDGQVPTDSARGAWTKAVRELSRVGATPTEIAARAAAFRALWPHVTLTPTALARRWAEITAGRAGHPGRADPLALAAGRGRTLARTDIPTSELDDHGPTDPAERAAFRLGFLTERRAVEVLA